VIDVLRLQQVLIHLMIKKIEVYRWHLYILKVNLKT